MGKYVIPQNKLHLLDYFRVDKDKKTLKKFPDLPMDVIKSYKIVVTATGFAHEIETDAKFDVAVEDLKKKAYEMRDKKLLDEVTELLSCKVS